MKRWWVKPVLFLGAILLALSTLLLSSRVRSKNAVERYKDELRAKGEKLNVNELTPPRVDPEKNGLKLFNEASHSMDSGLGVLDRNVPPAMRTVVPGKAMVGWRQGEIVSEYGSGFITNSWADIEQALKSQSPCLALLQQAGEFPFLDFELDYKQGFSMPLPHLIKMKRAAVLLSSAAIDALHRNDSFAAVTNVHTLLALQSAWKNEPTLISQLVRIAMAQITANAQWELLQATNLTDAQLALLQRDWMDLEFVRPMENALVFERGWSSVTIQQLRTSNSPSAMFAAFSAATSSGGGSVGWLGNFGQIAKRKTSDTLWRVSWSYSDELAALKGDEVLVETVRQVRTNDYFKDALLERDRKLTALGLDHPGTNWLRDELDDALTILGVESVNSVGHSLDRLLTTEAVRRMAVTGIALKRYRLRHAAWPADLDALVPEFLPQVPRDPVDGHMLRYHWNPDGTFLLYCIGKDGVDNGGDPAPDGPIKSWLRSRDWVWPQPASPADIQNYYSNPPK